MLGLSWALVNVTSQQSPVLDYKANSTNNKNHVNILKKIVYITAIPLIYKSFFLKLNTCGSVL